MILKIKMRPIGIAFVVFVVLYFSFRVFTRVIGWQIHSDMLLVVNAMGCFMWLIPGYVAASLAKTRGLLNGVVVGAGGVLFEGMDYYFSSAGLTHEFGEHWYIFLFGGVVLGGIGGLVWDIKAMIIKRRSNSSTM